MRTLNRRTAPRWLALLALAVLLLSGCGGFMTSSSDSAAGGGDESAGSAPGEAGSVEPGTPEDSGSGKGGATGGGGDGAATDEQSGGNSGGTITSVATATRSIIYRVDLGVQTEDVSGAVRRAVSLTRTAGGYVERENAVGDERDNGPRTASLVLRVPVQRFEAVVEDLSALGEVIYRDRTAQDVTEELVDVTSRIKSQQAALDRLRKLLERAESLSDVVVLEREVANREADLDSLQRRQKELAGLAELATISVEFSTPDSLNRFTEPDRGFLVGLDAGWTAFLASVAVVLTVLGALVPWTVVALVVVGPLLALWRSRRQRRRARRPAASADDATAGPGAGEPRPASSQP